MAAGSHVIRIDRSKPLRAEPHTGHNRWHPDIPPALRVDPGDTVVLERTIDVHVKTLRRKLGTADLIETVRGVGYRFRETAP